MTNADNNAAYVVAGWWIIRYKNHDNGYRRHRIHVTQTYLHGTHTTCPLYFVGQGSKGFDDMFAYLATEEATEL